MSRKDIIFNFLLMATLVAALVFVVRKLPHDPNDSCSVIYINAKEEIISVEECALKYDIEIKINGIEYKIDAKEKEWM